MLPVWSAGPMRCGRAGQHDDEVEHWAKGPRAGSHRVNLRISTGPPSLLGEVRRSYWCGGRRMLSVSRSQARRLNRLTVTISAFLVGAGLASSSIPALSAQGAPVSGTWLGS